MSLKARVDKIEAFQVAINNLSIVQPKKNELNEKLSDIFKVQANFPDVIGLGILNSFPANFPFTIPTGLVAMAAAVANISKPSEALAKALKRNEGGIEIKSKKSGPNK